MVRPKSLNMDGIKSKVLIWLLCFCYVMLSDQIKVIDKIRFGILSPEEIRKMSATKIVNADTYDEEGLQIPTGLMDPKLGTIEPGQRCATCGNRVEQCPGHFGHIELARPVVHVSYAKILLKILRAICPKCSRLMLTEDQINRFKDKQDKYMRIFKKTDKKLQNLIFKNARKAKTCPYCGADKKKITIEKPTTYYEESDEEKEVNKEQGGPPKKVQGAPGSRKLTTIELLERLEKMNQDDCTLMGINPETAQAKWMILTVLPIPPVCVRPSITLDSGIRSEDDLTHKLVDVIRINQRLRENLDSGAPQLIVEDLWELLQYHITTYFNNEVAGIPPARHRSGRALRTLTQRLKGKEGRFRSNLSGKRVDFSARTVISPNPHISINQVGVPVKVAMILTVPIYVTEFNIEELKQAVINGPNKHPGANYIVRDDGNRIDLRYAKKRELNAASIKPGYIIERHLKDDDIVLFNRQPSLHRMSIMAHRVKVMQGQTFRLALTVCPPYNADFDGDEMNLHVPQSEEARTEAEYLLKVQEHIISPRYGNPIIGGIQDFISMVYMFTRKEIRPGVPNLFSIKDAYNLIHWGRIFDHKPYFKIEDLKPINPNDERINWKFTGKEIFSTLLPYDLNMELQSKFCKKCEKCEKQNCPYDAYVYIRGGKLISGVIDDKSFGAGKSHSVLARIIRDYGNVRGAQFLDDATSMLIWVIILNGLTMAIDEVDIGPVRHEILNNIAQAEEQAAKYIQAFFNEDEEILPCDPGKTLEETLENKLMGLANEVRTKASEIAARHLGDNAHSVIMTKSGARGNALNLGQMAACVGQQAVRQKRIHRGYTGRTLPHFKLKDLSLKARGFVTSSYRVGLNPIEFFFHAMGGREGLVDTAVRTSSSGYMQRRLVNALQDMVVENDLTVRISDGSIIQFKYGDDKIDPGRSDAGKPIDLEITKIKAKALKDMVNIEKEIKNRNPNLELNNDEPPKDLIINDANEIYTYTDEPEEIPNLKAYEQAIIKLLEKRTIAVRKGTPIEQLEEPDINEFLSEDETKKKGSDKQDIEKAQEKGTKKETQELSDKELQEIYEKENQGKRAVWKGKMTDAYKAWKKEYLANQKKN